MQSGLDDLGGVGNQLTLRPRNKMRANDPKTKRVPVAGSGTDWATKSNLKPCGQAPFAV